MPQNTVNDVSQLTKEAIGDLYFRSLGNNETRTMHNPLLVSKGGPQGRSPTPGDLTLDFTCWYGGVISCANVIDPGVALPALKEMVGYINQNFERAKTAIAA